MSEPMDSRRNTAWRLRDVGAETMTIPQPTPDAAAGIAASAKVDASTRSGLDCVGWICVASVGAATLVIQLLEFIGGACPRGQAGGWQRQQWKIAPRSE